jgi:hypothetical protein
MGLEIPMHSSPLSLETTKHQLLRQRLLSEYPEADDETLQDTLKGITNLHEMIAAVIRSALVDEALQTGLRTRLEEMRQRLARLEERGVKNRHLAPDAICEVGLKKLEQPDFTSSPRAGMPPLVITAEPDIPQSYWVPQPPKLDRSSLLADLKRGKVIRGAQLGNPKPCLTVRTK